MKNKKILLALALTFVLGACSPNGTNSKEVSEETIQKALDGKVDLSQEEAKKEETNKKEKTADKEDNEITADLLRNFMTEIGEFSPALARSLKDKELITLYKQAERMSNNTGYWDVKDFFFQELAYEYPEQSLKFPLDSVASKYYWKASVEGEIGNKFEYERNVMVENGKDYNKVWSYTDKEVEDAFHEAYKKDPKAYYEDYVKMAYAILSGEEADIKSSDSEGAANPEDYENLLSFGSRDEDYKAIKDAMVKYYEFDKDVVDKIPNKDIDLAYTRAQKRLEETGFGDIGLIFDEIGKLYPGSSTMYPGE